VLLGVVDVHPVTRPDRADGLAVMPDLVAMALSIAAVVGSMDDSVEMAEMTMDLVDTYKAEELVPVLLVFLRNACGWIGIVDPRVQIADSLSPEQHAITTLLRHNITKWQELYPEMELPADLREVLG
jgi:hypothetical protein